jgi:peptidoglycan/xylan/chitin deacetylase (PgdA/CDA1 family)
MTRWPPVLMYHAITHVSFEPNNVCISPERFKAQMLHLKRRGLRGVSINELTRAAPRSSARGLLGLTFDDDYENFLHAALPVLEDFGFTATVFVVGGMLGGENSWDKGPRMRLLSAEAVRELAERGMEVGSHGMSHIRLSGLEPERLQAEVRGSRKVLGEVLGRPVERFCYPYGALNNRVVPAVREAGYDYACAYKAKPQHGAYDIPRMNVGDCDGDFRLELKLRWYRQDVRITHALGVKRS